MSIPDFELHRAIVHYSDTTTGEAQVRIPSLLGSGQVVNVPTTGLSNSDGFWNVPSIGSSVFIAVNSDKTQFLWITAVGIPGADGNSPGNEPIGHEDLSDSRMSFDNSTRTFTIQPATSSHVVWCVGRRYEKTITETITIPNTTGLYYISFNSQGQLQYSTDYFVWDRDTPTSYVYWNATTQRAEFFADERHGITMDWQTHEYLHRTRGAAIANGFDASNFDVSTHDGTTDAQAQLDIDNGTFFDEDLQVDIEHSLTPEENTWKQQLQGPARIPVMYRSGTGYVYDAPTDFPVKQGVTHPVYNSSSGGNWGTTELGTSKYGVQWIVATNQLNYPVLSIMGQTQYNNIGQAEAASWADMDLDDLPVVEIRVLYKIIFRATGSNTPGCYFVEIDDYRTALSNATSTAAAVVDHGNLTGLGDDDHPQYALADGSRGSGFDHGNLTGLGDDDHSQYLLADGTRTAAAITTTGNVDVGGTISGNGSGLTTLNASNLSSGTVASARISGSYTGITGTGALDAGSITSGFGAINNGTSGATMAGTVTIGGTTQYLRIRDTTDNSHYLEFRASLSANRIATFPNASGTVITTGNLSDITSVGLLTSLSTTGAVSSASVDSTGAVKAQGPDGGMVLRNWQANAAYGMVGTVNMTGSEYALITDGTNTYIGAGTGGTTHIRGPANDTSPQITNNGTNVEITGTVLLNVISLTDEVQGGNGSETDPTYTFTSDGDTGMYRNTTNQLGLTAGGSAGLFVASGTVNTAGLATGTTSGYQYVLRNNTFGTLYRFTSNRAMKEQITPVGDVGPIIDALQPVTFVPAFIPQEEGETETDEQRTLRENDLQYGFIAEDIAQVDAGHLAQWEWEDDDLSPAGWRWPDMIAVLTAEVQSLRVRVATLEGAVA
jgi:hypothetical protein